MLINNISTTSVIFKKKVSIYNLKAKKQRKNGRRVSIYIRLCRGNLYLNIYIYTYYVSYEKSNSLSNLNVPNIIVQTI